MSPVLLSALKEPLVIGCSKLLELEPGLASLEVMMLGKVFSRSPLARFDSAVFGESKRGLRMFFANPLPFWEDFHFFFWEM